MRRMNPTLAVPDNLATPRAKCWPTYCEDETGRRMAMGRLTGDETRRIAVDVTGWLNC